MAAVGPVLAGPFAPDWYSAHISWEPPRFFRSNASVGEFTASSALEILSPGGSEFLIGRSPGPDHPTRLPRRTGAEPGRLPDTARLLPVMVPTLARASRPAGLLDSSSSAPWRTMAYPVPAEAG